MTRHRLGLIVKVICCLAESAYCSRRFGTISPDVVSKASHDARIAWASPVCLGAPGDGSAGSMANQTESHAIRRTRLTDLVRLLLVSSAPGIDAGRRTLESLCATSKTTGWRRETAKASTCSGPSFDRAASYAVSPCPGRFLQGSPFKSQARQAPAQPSKQVFLPSVCCGSCSAGQPQTCLPLRHCGSGS